MAASATTRTAMRSARGILCGKFDTASIWASVLLIFRHRFFIAGIELNRYIRRVFPVTAELDFVLRAHPVGPHNYLRDQRQQELRATNIN